LPPTDRRQSPIDNRTYSRDKPDEEFRQDYRRISIMGR
jgi:hypothetical protein